MQKFPALLSALHLLEFDYADGEGIDFEPYDEFLAPDEVTDWFRAWTGNSNLTGMNIWFLDKMVVAVMPLSGVSGLQKIYWSSLLHTLVRKVS